MNFQQKLKALYKKNDKIAPLIEGLEEEIPQQTLDEYYVKLKTIIKEDEDKKQGNYETISGKKQEVEVEDIFKQPSIRRLLILGGAGVGKSTLMQYMAYRWSTTNLWKDKFDYVYRITLKTLLNVGWDRDYDKTEREDELKCLAHYNLVALGAQGEGGCKLKDMPWLEKKNKVLLLLDGYDEVAHERNGLYKRVFENIFAHENIILTSRPNAIDKQMAEKFGKKIENTGLDYQGIEKYLSQYFKKNQEKGESLKEFLDKNSSIKEICHIPVNIAMMCFIWSESDSNSALHEISNMSDLYKQVVDHLGFRYFAKFNNNNFRQNQDELMSKWKGGEIYLDELQVLEHTAYKGMTGGGLQIPEDKRSETLIIKGMTKKGDKDGISIQSSINYLRDQLKKDMPTINKVYKYGLLKPEGALIDAAENKTKKEPSETDLQEQSFSFIHLSFQEFLTALYLVQHLLKENNKEEQERIASFIAQHRNEPRYLMTLKLMAGILSAFDEDHREAEQGIKIFWDSIMCNPDGVLELGVEAKVTLLMHLLGQTRKENSIDKRIPNANLAIDLIDSIVLQNLATWGAQLKESDFLSPNIKEGLIQFFVRDNKNWMADMSSKLQEKFTKEVNKKSNSAVSTEAVLEIIGPIINKFSQDEQHQIFAKLVQHIRNHTEDTWQFTKKAIETIFTVHQKTKLNLVDEKKELLDALLVTIYDSNLTEISMKGMQEILNVPKDPLLLEKIKAHIKEPATNIKAEVVINTKRNLLNIVNPDVTYLKDVINLSFAPFLQDPIRDVRILAVKTITEINTDRLDAFNFLLPFLQDSEIKESVSDYLKILVNKDGHQKLFLDRINTLIPRLKDSEMNTVIVTSSELAELIKIKGDPLDIKLVLDIIKTLTKSEAASTCIRPFARVTCQNNPFAAKAIIKDLTELLQDPVYDVRKHTFQCNQELLQVIDNDDIQFFKETIDTMALILKTSKVVGSSVKEWIDQIVRKNHNVCKDVVKAFTPLLQNSDDSIRETTLITMTNAVFQNYDIAKDVVNALAPLAKHSEKAIKELPLSNLPILFKKHLRQEPEFAIDIVMKSLIPVLSDSDNDIRLLALETILDILELFQINDTQHLRDFTKAMISLLKDSDGTIRRTAALGFEIILERSHTELIRDSIKALTPLLHDPDSNVKIWVGKSITSLMNLDENSDAEFRKEILTLMTPLLQDSDEAVQMSIIERIPEVISLPLSKDAIQIMASLLQDSRLQIKIEALKKLTKIAKIDKSIVRDIFAFLSQALQDGDTKNCAANLLLELVKIAKKSEIQLSRDVLNLLSPLLQDPDNDLKQEAIELLSKLASENPRDIQFGRDIVNLLIPFLQDEIDDTRKIVLHHIDNIIKLVHNKDIDWIKSIVQVLLPLLNHSSPETRRLVSLEYLPIVIKLLEKPNAQIIQKAFDGAISCLKEPDGRTKRQALEVIPAFVQLFDVQLSRKALEASIPLLNDSDERVRKWAELHIPDLIELDQEIRKDTAFLKSLLSSLTPLLEGYEISATIGCILEIAKLTNDAQLAKDIIRSLIPIFSGRTSAVTTSITRNMTKVCADRDISFTKEVLDEFFVPLLKDTHSDVKNLVSIVIKETIKQKNDTTDIQFVRNIVEKLVPLLQDPSDHTSQSTSSNIIEILHTFDNAQLTKDVVNIIAPYFQHSNSDIAKNAFRILESVFHKLFLTPDIFAQYLTHSSKNLRDFVAEFLLEGLQKYLEDFQKLDQLFQCPLSDLTVDIIMQGIFENNHPLHQDFQQNLQNYLEKGQEEPTQIIPGFRNKPDQNSQRAPDH